MHEETFKLTLLSLQEEARAELVTFAAEVSETDRQSIGTLQRWSAKDLLAHIASWWHTQGQRLARVADGDLSTSFAWSDEMNAALFTANANRTWESVMAEILQSASEWQRAVQRLSLEHLLLRDPKEEGDGYPLWRLVLSNGYLHPLLHLTEHYLECGKLVQAIYTQEKMATKLIAPSLPKEVHSLSHYNLACFYAQIARADDAVTELGKAFVLDPALRSVAQQDTDFTPIQTQPAFLALFDSVEGDVHLGASLKEN